MLSSIYVSAHTLLSSLTLESLIVQCIVDLADPMLSEPLILKFRGRVCDLSKQKFSSNVIEKVRHVPLE